MGLFYKQSVSTPTVNKLRWDLHLEDDLLLSKDSLIALDFLVAAKNGQSIMKSFKVLLRVFIMSILKNFSIHGLSM